jgi:hypothetical protein
MQNWASDRGATGPYRLAEERLGELGTRLQTRARKYCMPTCTVGYASGERMLQDVLDAVRRAAMHRSCDTSKGLGTRGFGVRWGELHRILAVRPRRLSSRREYTAGSVIDNVHNEHVGYGGAHMLCAQCNVRWTVELLPVPKLPARMTSRSWRRHPELPDPSHGLPSL